MHRLAWVALLLFGCTPFPSKQERVLAFEGGRWFTGTGFEPRTAYSSGGTLTFEAPARIDERIDLAGGYVVPPFGEAHNHNIEGGPGFEATVARYLRDGVFYVRNPNVLPRARRAIAGRLGGPTGIDASFANGGITAAGGHPATHVRQNVARGVWTEADGEGAFYVVADDAAGLARVWPAVLAGKPEFIKTFLLYSEEHARRRDDPAFDGWKGLDPALLPQIVRLARAARLRVVTHVETAADFHHALAAGVDEIAHLPGFRGDAEVALSDPSIFEINEDDARLAARLGTVVATTVGGIRGIDPNGPQAGLRQSFDRLHRRNLALLHAHGVQLVVGSDDYGDTSAPEAMYLHGLGVFDNATLLRMWSQATPQAIFPTRRVGCLDEGCDASFLVLSGNPIDDFGHVRDIAMRIKEGRVLGTGERPGAER